MSNLVGIDLGTTYSAISRLDETGRPEIIDNSEGENITPSIVLFESKSNVVVGNVAQQNYGIDENTFGRFKRVMGDEKKEYEAFGKKYNPAALSSFVLKKLKEDAEETIGPISEAVVTVPANFANQAREATLAAAKSAGLTIKNIINEPTAAALYYAYSSGEELNGVYAVYDLGGGTFDVSIIKVEGSDIDVITSDGVNKLGGDDFDDILIEIVKGKYKEETGKVLDDEAFTKNDAEVNKKILSSREKTSIMLSSTKGRGKVEITRKEFEDAISSKIAATEITCENALEEAELSSDDINEVILVGGSTRMPCVKSSVEKVFKKKPKTFGNPDEAVALGAALYVAYKADPSSLTPLQRKAISKVNIADVTSKFFGTNVLDMTSTQGQSEVFNDILIKKGEKIPTSVVRDYSTVHDNQTAIQCTVNESNTDEKDPEFVTEIWNGVLELPAGRPAGQPIKVTFNYTENQTMACTFLDVQSGKKKEIDLTADNANTKTELDIDDFKVE